MSNSYRFPKQLNLWNSITFANCLARLEPETPYTFDFGNMEFVYPFGALLTCLSIRNFRQKHRNIEVLVDTNESSGTSYAKRMGFFQAAGFSIGDPPCSYDGPTYLPVCISDTSEFRLDGLPEADSVRNLSRQFASRLMQSDTDCLAEQTVSFAFQEIVRNVLEHSRSSIIAYCAQYYPQRNEVEIAIADLGNGLRHSLSRNPRLAAISEARALEYALMPGVSGTTFKGAKRYHAEPVVNAGLGLYFLYRLCNEGGEFVISSGQCALHKSSKSNHQLLNAVFPGTIVGIRLILDNTRQFEMLQNKYSAEGRAVQRQVTHGILPGHERVSSLLSENFLNASSDISVGSRVMHPKKGKGTVLEIFNEHSQVVARVSLDGGGEPKIAISKLIHFEE